MTDTQIPEFTILYPVYVNDTLIGLFLNKEDATIFAKNNSGYVGRIVSDISFQKLLQMYIPQPNLRK